MPFVADHCASVEEHFLPGLENVLGSTSYAGIRVPVLRPAPCIVAAQFWPAGAAVPQLTTHNLNCVPALGMVWGVAVLHGAGTQLAWSS
jgi:hypothetical protein